MSTKTNWICCQLGAREHYAIPRALSAAGQLTRLVTDTWTRPGSLFGRVAGNRGRERYHADLGKAPITAWNWPLALFELERRKKREGWDLVMDRNEWFQQRALQVLHRSGKDHAVLFSYSYTALRLFEFAKKAGWRTVLGQIDPGPVEERLVTGLHTVSPQLGNGWQSAPRDYWRQWRRECELADTIVVNSEWSREALITEGIPSERIHIIPLVYEPPAEATQFKRTYPNRFTHDRPLRALFLGQINLRKGIGPILGAVDLLKGLPIRFRMVGPIQIEIPDRLRNHPQIEWAGAVPRGAAASEYRNADIFLFPTLSDGFGLTQLEAQAWQLPLIASRHCGAVVRDGENGWLLRDVTAHGLSEILRTCVASPETLCRMAVPSATKPTGLSSLQEALLACAS